MHLFKYYQHIILEILHSLQRDGLLPSNLPLERVVVEPPRDPEHGDMATNAALVLAKSAATSSQELATLLGRRLENTPGITHVTTVPPGFINFCITNSVWQQTLKRILKEGAAYGNGTLGQNQVINVEYVSVNPTGPMHAGHARVSVVGDTLASLLQKAGYTVVKEFYINDAGGQADKLARSAYLRYLEALGHHIGSIEEGYYPGDYLIPVGHQLAQKYGTQWVDRPEKEWMEPIRSFALEQMMILIRADLESLGIHHDVFRSERDIVSSGKVESVLEILQHYNLLYTGVLEPPKGMIPDDWEPRPQLLFKSTQFGDDVDRPLKKSDGSWTYFSNDIAYHLDKLNRGAHRLINIWGADHGGYVKRLTAAVQALTESKSDITVILCQLVKFVADAMPLKMSKRAGQFVSLQEVIQRVGRDVIRFMMVTRKNDMTLDFDFQKVFEQSKDNPVFYVQYAHARTHSVMRQARTLFAQEDLPNRLNGANLELIEDEHELAMIKILAHWPRQVEMAALALEPHRVAFYLHEVAAVFHGLWNQGKEHAHLRFITPDNLEKTWARLALVQAVQHVLVSGLTVLGVTPVEEMVG